MLATKQRTLPTAKKATHRLLNRDSSKHRRTMKKYLKENDDLGKSVYSNKSRVDNEVSFMSKVHVTLKVAQTETKHAKEKTVEEISLGF